MANEFVIPIEFDREQDVFFFFPNCHGVRGAILVADKRKVMSLSEVFKAQFSSANRGSVISGVVIDDIPISIFCKIIWGDLEIVEDNFLDLLRASQKYAISDLTDKVIYFVKIFINEHNIHKYFEAIEEFNVKILNDHMMKVIIKNPCTVIRDLTLSAPHKRMLRMILQSSYIPCSEFQLYSAVVRMFYNRTKSLDHGNFRYEMGDLVYLIRFPTMSIQQLIGCGQSPSLLAPQQLIDLLLWKQEKILSKTLELFSHVLRESYFN